MKPPKISYFHHFVHGRKLPDNMNKSIYLSFLDKKWTKHPPSQFLISKDLFFRNMYDSPSKKVLYLRYRTPPSARAIGLHICST